MKQGLFEEKKRKKEREEKKRKKSISVLGTVTVLAANYGKGFLEEVEFAESDLVFVDADSRGTSKARFGAF
jgi:hypothetical protein